MTLPEALWDRVHAALDGRRDPWSDEDVLAWLDERPQDLGPLESALARLDTATGARGARVPDRAREHQVASHPRAARDPRFSRGLRGALAGAAAAVLLLLPLRTLAPGAGRPAPRLGPRVEAPGDAASPSRARLVRVVRTTEARGGTFREERSPAATLRTVVRAPRPGDAFVRVAVHHETLHATLAR